MADEITLTPAQIALASGEPEKPPVPSTGAGPKMDANLPVDAGGDGGDTDDGADAGREEPDESRYIPDGSNGTSKGGDAGGGDVDDEAPEWLDDAAKAYAASYGLSDEDMQQFGSLEELERFGRLSDQRISAASGGDASPADKGAASDGAATGQQAADTQSAAVELQLVDPQKFIDEGYDETTVGLARALRQTQEVLQSVLPLTRDLATRTQAEQEAGKRRELTEFHQALDQIDPILFGKMHDGDTVKDVSVAHDGNRKAVLETAGKLRVAIANNFRQRGMEPVMPSPAVLAQRAANLVFGPGGRTPNSRLANADAIREQSRKRRPANGGARRDQGGKFAGSGGAADQDDPAAIAQNPEIKKFFRDAQRANGRE